MLRSLEAQRAATIFSSPRPLTELRLRPRTVSELVDAAIALYKRDAALYILAAAIGYTPYLILELFFLRPDSLSNPFAGGLVTIVLSLASLVTTSFMSAVVVKLGSQAYLGNAPDLATTVAEVAPRVPALVVAAILKAALIIIGAMFLLVGALYVVARYFAVASVVVLEDKGPLSAFGRSSELSVGRKGHLLKALLLVFLIYFVLSLGVTAFASLAHSTVVTRVATAAWTIVGWPLVGLTEMVLYYDARIRGEGFDLEHLAASLDAGTAARPAGGVS